MAGTAELEVQTFHHGKLFCCLLFDIEDIGMAICTVQPLRMGLVRKDRRWYAKFWLEVECLIKRHWMVIAHDSILRFDKTFFESGNPVNSISIWSHGKMRKLFKLFLAIRDIPVMTLVAIFFCMSEGDLSVMAGSTIFPLLVGLFRNYSCI